MERYKTAWMIFIFVNILTYPLSPHGGAGLMSEAAYKPVMVVKLTIIALLLLWGAVLVSSKFLKSRRMQIS